VQDEAELSLFPTLTRTWRLRGRQKRVRAPGVHPPQRHEGAATDWRTGASVRVRGEKRDAETFCRLLEACLARSARRKRRVLVVTDSPRIHTPEGSLRVRALLREYGQQLRLRSIPKYEPDCMPREQLWDDWRQQGTHNHDRLRIEELEGDSDHYFEERAKDAAAVLRTISSPYAKHRQNRKT
jgi:DDE superfamily endonuclease